MTLVSWVRLGRIATWMILTLMAVAWAVGLMVFVAWCEFAATAELLGDVSGAWFTGGVMLVIPAIALTAMARQMLLRRKAKRQAVSV